jgi:NADH:ubiquinone oxidoreductase subunit E
MDQKETCACKELSEEEKLRLIEEVINDYKDKEGSLIQILHMTQSIYGYLPLEIQKLIARRLNKPLSEISGVVSFYSFFCTQPKGEYTIRVCLGTACYVRGGKKIIERLKEILGIDIGETTEDRKFTLEVMRCIGACGLAPAISINDVVYKQVNPDKLNEIIKKYY